MHTGHLTHQQQVTCRAGHPRGNPWVHATQVTCWKGHTSTVPPQPSRFSHGSYAGFKPQSSEVLSHRVACPGHVPQPLPAGQYQHEETHARGFPDQDMTMDANKLSPQVVSHSLACIEGQIQTGRCPNEGRLDSDLGASIWDDSLRGTCKGPKVVTLNPAPLPGHAPAGPCLNQLTS